mmetsp:Transcript_13813/g.23560  ORF Transcript_13813/g.23560 Transcript_13813/m.23560 type:complete len:91 (-) Transcript_13813:505-777(-)
MLLPQAVRTRHAAEAGAAADIPSVVGIVDRDRNIVAVALLVAREEEGGTLRVLPEEVVAGGHPMEGVASPKEEGAAEDFRLLVPQGEAER